MVSTMRVEDARSRGVYPDRPTLPLDTIEALRDRLEPLWWRRAHATES